MSIPTLVILGPSNAGKTPVGQTIQQRSALTARRSLHLDFGDHLRRCCAGTIDPGFTADQRALIDTFMQGRLLDHDSFFIAHRIVHWFLKQHRFDPHRDLLVLNGLPRNVAQARSLAEHDIVVRCALHLDCPIEVARQRKQRSDNGRGFEDRSGRTDGSDDVFRRKSESYLADTLPLVAHYRRAGVPVVRVPVDVDTSPDDVAETLFRLISDDP